MPGPHLIAELALYVKELYKENQGPDLLYHNLEHTENVVQRTHQIAANYSFDERERFILSAAAWFHDTGQLFGEPRRHEERSILIMREYLNEKNIEKKIVSAIGGCILATKVPQDPHTVLEEIICDADTFHLGTKEFIYTDSQLRKEFKLRNAIPSGGWDESTLAMLKKHKYFTPYCQELLNKGKQENIEMISRKIKDKL